MSQIVVTLPQIYILLYLKDNGYDLIMKSTSVADLEKAFLADPDCESFSQNVIRNALDGLLMHKLVALGVKCGATYTYYITDAGKEYVSFAFGDRSSSRKKNR